MFARLHDLLTTPLSLIRQSDSAAVLADLEPGDSDSHDAILSPITDRRRTQRWRGYQLGSVTTPRGNSAAHVLEMSATGAVIAAATTLLDGEMITIALPIGRRFAEDHNIEWGNTVTVTVTGHVLGVDRLGAAGHMEPARIAFLPADHERLADLLASYPEQHGMRPLVAA